MNFKKLFGERPEDKTSTETIYTDKQSVFKYVIDEKGQKQKQELISLRYRDIMKLLYPNTDTE